MGKQIELFFKKTITTLIQFTLMVIFLTFYPHTMSAIPPWLKRDLLDTYVKTGISSIEARPYINAMSNSLDEQEFPIIDTEKMRGFLQRTLMAGTLPLGRSAKELYGVFDTYIIPLFTQLRIDRKSLSRERAENFVFETLISIHSAWTPMREVKIFWYERNH